MNRRAVIVAVLVAAVVALGGLAFYAGHLAAGGHGAGTRPTVVASTPASGATTGPAQAGTPAPATTGAEPSDPGEDPTQTWLPAPTKAGQPGLTDFATAFAASWLNTTGRTTSQWLGNLTDRCTPQLADLLTDTDLTTVPVGFVGAPVRTAPAGDYLYTAVVPIVASRYSATPVGTLTLEISGASGRWLTSDIDWTPA